MVQCNIYVLYGAKEALLSHSFVKLWWNRPDRVDRGALLAGASTCDIDMSRRARHLRRGYLELKKAVR